jgi:ATP-dependent DNA helicase RecG
LERYVHPARQALTLPPDEVGNALVALREDQWFDRKSARTSPVALAPVISGMANAEGGLIALGLHSGTVEGIESTGDENGWRQANLEFVDPPASVRIHKVACQTTSGNDDHLMVLDVEPSERLHKTNRDEVYLRVGDETKKLTFDQRLELAFDKGDSKYETTPAKLTPLTEIDEGLVRRWDPDGEGTQPVELLRARGFVRGDELTVGGALLFTRVAHIEFPEAHLRVILHRGRERGTGSRQTVAFDERYEGPLTEQIDRAIAAVTEHVPTRRALGDDGRFTTIPAIPRDARLEGVVNAVTHRSYSLAGDHTRIEIFDDRIEIRSPGRFPGIVDIQDPESISRYARNPRIARVLADLRYGQERGEGIKRMFEEMRLARLAEPLYVEGDRDVVLTLSASPVDEALESRLPSTARAIVRHLRQHQRASTGELLKVTGLSRPALRSHLDILRREGVIAWHGNAPRDPRAYWYLPN